MKSKLFSGFNLSFLLSLFLVSLMSCDSLEIPEPADKINDSKPVSLFAIQAENNPNILSKDVFLKVIGSRLIGRVPGFVDKSSITVTLQTDQYKLIVDGVEQENGVVISDLTRPVNYILVNERDTLQYELILINSSELPAVFISTNNNPVEDKVNWIDAHICIDGNGTFDDVEMEKFYIRGRGNSTWVQEKKPYALKFDKKTALLGMPQHKRWVLMANHLDLTMIRGYAGLLLGEKYSKLDYTPRMQFVDLYVEGKYAGLYELGEQIRVDENRVNVGKLGFIVEVDAKPNGNEPIFETPNGVVFNIKDADFEIDIAGFDYVRRIVVEAEDALYSEDFLHPAHGYKKYIDTHSFVEWYLVNEITKNNDAIFYTSCYMNYMPGGKIKMGPLWDFDLAFGNSEFNDSENPKGLWIRHAAWISRMFEDPEFIRLVKIRFDHYYRNRRDFYAEINLMAEKLKRPAFQNNILWNVFPSTPSQVVTPSYFDPLYQTQVQTMIQWLDVRFEWLNNYYAAL